MTKSNTSETARPGWLAWRKARRLLGSNVNGLPDWPESFTPAELAALQHPWDGTASEIQAAKRRQGAMLAALKVSIEAGQIATTSRTGTHPITENRRASRPNHGTANFANMYGALGNSTFRNAAPSTVRVTVGERAEQVTTIERGAFSAWLMDYGEEPSALVLAWLSYGDADRRKPGQPNAPAKLRGDQQDKVDCQTIAVKLWEEYPTLTITGAGMASRPELLAYKKQWPIAFVKWLREVAPEGVRNKRGRPKKNSQPAE